MIPSSRSMLSRDKRLPLDTWDTSGSQKNVFPRLIHPRSSSRNSPLRNTKRRRISSTSNRDRDFLSRDKRLPLDTWNQSGIQENVFGHLFCTFDSPRDHPQRIQSDDVQRNREAVPEAGRMKTIHTSEDRQNQGTIPMPTFARRPSPMSSFIPVEFLQNSMVGQQRQQISELQFDKFLKPQTFLVWKIHKPLPVLIFHRKQCYGSKKWRWLIHWRN